MRVAANLFDPGHQDGAAGTDETFTGTVDWGDGTVEVVTVTTTAGGVGVPTAGEFAATHVYADDGTYTITVRALDDDQGVGLKKFDVLVENVAPELVVTGSGQIVPGETRVIDEGNAQNLFGQITDAGASDTTFLYYVDWGDGQTTGPLSATIDGLGVAELVESHSYLQPGTYPVSVRVADDDMTANFLGGTAAQGDFVELAFFEQGEQSGSVCAN